MTQHKIQTDQFRKQLDEAKSVGKINLMQLQGEYESLKTIIKEMNEGSIRSRERHQQELQANQIQLNEKEQQISKLQKSIREFAKSEARAAKSERAASGFDFRNKRRSPAGARVDREIPACKSGTSIAADGSYTTEASHPSSISYYSRAEQEAEIERSSSGAGFLFHQMHL